MSNIKCIGCDIIFSKLNEFSVHLNSHKIIIFKCNIVDCVSKYSRKSCFVQHLENDHKILSAVSSNFIVDPIELCPLNSIEPTLQQINSVSQHQQISSREHLNNNSSADIRSDLFKLASQLYSDPKIPKSTIEYIMKNFKTVLDKLIKDFSEHSLSKFEDIFNCQPNFEFLRSEYMFVNELKTNYSQAYIPAQTFVVHKERESVVAQDNTLRIKDLKCTVKYISS